MPIYKLTEIPTDIKIASVDKMLADETHTLTMTAALCEVLTEKHGVSYVPYGADANEPVTTFRPI